MAGRVSLSAWQASAYESSMRWDLIGSRSTCYNGKEPFKDTIGVNRIRAKLASSTPNLEPLGIHSGSKVSQQILEHPNYEKISIANLESACNGIVLV
ncbi:hypothetical protein PR202_gb02601 [Eleusine coracana subsp. coracana]|uniref:Uncharacterized protein n=1 Tax=Eleusine coracana subsp. coracana TaxID=191504 RepID=A0AAV5DZ36_ELECO|nr:hypothetical protein PR202_gb02601 [Eleusine coracana subsp. coracana]